MCFVCVKLSCWDMGCVHFVGVTNIYMYILGQDVVCQDIIFVCAWDVYAVCGRVSRLLAHTCMDFDNLCSLTNTEDYCTPTYVSAPWTDIVMACVNFRLETLCWKVCVCHIMFCLVTKNLITNCNVYHHY